jgi:hypothetical protein
MYSSRINFNYKLETKVISLRLHLVVLAEKLTLLSVHDS